jgi:hypothetical protein
MPGAAASAAPLRVQAQRDVGGRHVTVELHPGSSPWIKREPKSLIWREVLDDGTDAVIKLYRRGFGTWCRSRIGGFRASREFRALHQLQSLGERCVVPLFWAHGHFDGYGWSELLATRSVADCEPLDQVLRNEKASGGPRIDLAPLWATVGRLHHAGLHHGTLLARNILVVRASGQPQFMFLDLPRFHRFPYDIRGTRMARYDLLFLTNTLLRGRPMDEVRPWLAAYGMSDEKLAQFVRDLRRFRNSPWLRRVRGLEFNVRAVVAGVRAALRKPRAVGTG